MDLRASEAFNTLFRLGCFSTSWSLREANGSRDTIVDAGIKTVSYDIENASSVKFNCPEPSVAFDVITRADDENNWYRRCDVSQLTDDRIRPLHVIFEVANPKYFGSMDINADEIPTHLEEIRFRFFHPETPSNISFGPILRDDMTLNRDFITGPTLRAFTSAINGLEKWSDLDFTVFADERMIEMDPGIDRLKGIVPG